MESLDDLARNTHYDSKSGKFMGKFTISGGYPHSKEDVVFNGEISKKPTYSHSLGSINLVGKEANLALGISHGNIVFQSVKAGEPGYQIPIRSAFKFYDYSPSLADSYEAMDIIQVVKILDQIKDINKFGNYGLEYTNPLLILSSRSGPPKPNDAEIERLPRGMYFSGAMDNLLKEQGKKYEEFFATVMNELYKRGANPGAVNDRHCNRNVLMELIGTSNAVVRSYYVNGDIINKGDCRGNTPLAHAVMKHSNNPQFVTWFLQFGASPSAVNSFGESPLDYARRNSLVDILQSFKTAESAQKAPKPEPKPSLNVGSQAPDFDLETIDGKRMKLSDLGGKMVLINFCNARDATVCRNQMSYLQNLYKQFIGLNFEIVAIFTDKEKGEKVEPLVKDLALAFPVLFDSAFETAKKYGISSIPETYFVGGDGKIIAHTSGVISYDTPETLEAIKKALPSGDKSSSAGAK